MSSTETVAPSRSGSVDNIILATIREHLGAEPVQLPQLTERYKTFQSINVQAAIDAYSTGEGRTVRLLGASVPPPEGFAALIGQDPDLTTVMTSDNVQVAGVTYDTLPSGVDEEMVVVHTGLYLFDGPEGPVAVWAREEGRRPHSERALDVIAPTVEAAKAFLATIDELMVTHNKFRGQWVQFRGDGFGNITVDFEAKPNVSRDELILPDGVLDAIEGHAIKIGAARNRLIASGRHLKRGLLLYGPPGTGKTHTVRYLASQLPEATLFVLAGSGMAAIDFIKGLVKDVTPAIVVLDDVDLIAEDRSLPGMAPRQLLFSLLDAMDGTREDEDVLFVCTSNRADTVEGAIASRPGRIDYAVEVGRPGAPERKRLLELYARGMDLNVTDVDGLVEATDGVTASFIKELLRRSWLVARADGTRHVVDKHVNEALNILLDPANPLTPDLLGVSPEALMQRQKARGSGQAWCGI